MALTVIGFYAWIDNLPNRQQRPDALVPVRFIPARFDAAGFAPLRFAGAWRVQVADARFGGVSALAVKQGSLLALTDSGTIVRFPRPGLAGPAFVHDLVDGPGSPGFKSDRDSEALAREAAGRGWWVAFENWQQLWLYDPDFRAVLRRIDLGQDRWRHNRGVEAMIARGDALALFPEGGDEWLKLRGPRLSAHRLASRFGSISDAVLLPDGSLLLVTRKLGLAGLAKHLVVVVQSGDGSLTLRALAGLKLGALDNVEAIAAEPHAGGTRLWLMTDNDFRARAPTYLVALDLP